MPVLLAALIGGLVEAAGSMMGRWLLAAGFGFVEYAGISATIDWVTGQIHTSLCGMGGIALTVLTLCKVDSFCSIILSAIGVKFLLQGLSSGGSIRRMVQK